MFFVAALDAKGPSFKIDLYLQHPLRPSGDDDVCPPRKSHKRPSPAQPPPFVAVSCSLRAFTNPYSHALEFIICHAIAAPGLWKHTPNTDSTSSSSSSSQQQQQQHYNNPHVNSNNHQPTTTNFWKDPVHQLPQEPIQPETTYPPQSGAVAGRTACYPSEDAGQYDYAAAALAASLATTSLASQPPPQLPTAMESSYGTDGASELSYLLVLVTALTM